MSVLFFIGNGFDVALGLKTQTKDFLTHYVSRKDSKTTPAVVKLMCDIESDMRGLKTWANLEAKLGEYTDGYDDTNVQDCIDAYQDIQKCLNDYIKGEDSNAKQAVEEIKSSTVTAIFDEILEFFTDFISKVAKGHNTKIKNCLQANRRGHVNPKNIYYNFLNFNYTSALELCVGNIKSPVSSDSFNWTSSEVKSVHGKIDNYPIIGVDNVSQIKNAAFREKHDILSLLVKPFILKELQGDEVATATQLINKSCVICIFGMSLGSTDKTWWAYIGNWLIKYANRILVIFSYTREFQSVLSSARLSKEKSIRDNFLKLANMEDASQELRDRIIVKVHGEMFTSKLIQ